MATSVDTLRIYERLKGANLDEKAAKEIAEVFKEVVEDRLATKKDLDEGLERVRADIKSDLLFLEAKLEAKMKLYFLVLIFVIILASPKAMDIIGKLLGFIK